MSYEAFVIDDAADFSHSLRGVSVSPAGRHILYRRKQEASELTPLTILDLETKGKEDVFFDWPKPSRSGNLNYGFSKDSLRAYALLTSGQLAKQREAAGGDPGGFSDLRDRNYIKALRLFEGESRMIPMPSGRVLSAGLNEGRSKMFVMSISKEHAEQLAEMGDRERGVEPLLDFMRNLPIQTAVLDMDSGRVSEDEIKMFSKDEDSSCHVFNESLGRVVTRRDGSMYAIPIEKPESGKSEGGAGKTELFGPLEGIRVKGYIEAQMPLSDLYNPFRGWNCVFLTENISLMKNRKGQFIVRRIKEREQFVFEEKDALGGFKSAYPNIGAQEIMLNSINNIGSVFPFFAGLAKKEGELAFFSYHIPTNKFQLIETEGLTNIQAGRGGRFAMETRIIEGLEKTAAVLNPFEPEKRRILREWDQSEICHQSFNEDRSLAFVSSIYGDLFVIDGHSGILRRRFIGGCLAGLKISDNGRAIVFKARELREANAIPQSGIEVRKFQETCFQPLSSLPESAAESLAALAEADNPSNPELLAVLAKAAEDEEALAAHADLIREALWNVFLRYPRLYRHLHALYPGLRDVPPFPSSFLDRTLESRASARLALKDVFQLALSFRFSRLSEWGFIKKLQPVIHALSESEREAYMDQITESVSNGASLAVPLFQDVFQSKIYYTARGHVRELFGLPREPASDLTVVRKKNSAITVILSSDPIQNHPSKRSDFGVHYAVVEEASFKGLSDSRLSPLILDFLEREGGPFASGSWAGASERGGALEADSEAGGSRSPEIFDGWIRWGLKGGGSYRAHLRIQAKTPDFMKRLLASRRLSPNYQDVWADRRMTGIMIIGSSLRPFSKTLVEEYAGYFESRGFEFESMPAPDFKDFFLEKVRSCELDYFLKESHSDGDERNVFRFNSESHVLRGSRRDSRGEREVIYLAFPPPFYMMRKPRTELLSSHELGRAIAERERAGCGEITYFNTSCWAHVKARSEIEAVGSDLFLNIPSQSMSDTFLNESGSAIRALLDSYRQGLDFEGFRGALRQNKGYASGKINDYIFPDERRYIDKIFRHIAVPMDIQIDLEREEEGVWRAISPDEAL